MSIMSEPLERLLLTRFLMAVSGVNMSTARNAISGHLSSMIKLNELNVLFQWQVLYFTVKSESVKPRIKMHSQC